jgi:hypothetical protein
VSDAAELIRVARRVADRLGVVGPRMAARSSASAHAVLDDVRGVLQELADLGADAEAREHRPVPVLGAHALGDQMLVLAHDIAGTADSAGPAVVERATALLRALSARI